MGNESIRHIKSSGGLGNQLFQYAFGLFLKKSFGGEIAYFQEPGSLIKHYSIEDLIGHLHFSDEPQLKVEHYYFKNKLQYRFVRKIYELFPWISQTKMVETGSKYQDNITSSHHIFDGYWQSYYYVKPIEHILRETIHFPEYTTELSCQDEIIHSESVFIHIRRGDYLSNKNKKLFATQELEYFKKAAQIIQEHLKNPIFFVFSNDIEWVKNHFDTSKGKYVFVKNEGKYSDLKDFQLMSQCLHGIISNSSFSWWAAYLIANTQKMIIAPKKWYVGSSLNEMTKDLIPPEWRRI